MKLTYKSNKGEKAVVKVNAKLVNNGDGTAHVEITNMEALKLAATLLYWHMADTDLGYTRANPVALDTKAEEMVEVTHFDVKTNGGPKVGVTTQTIDADITRVVDTITADFRSVEFKDAPKAAVAE